MCRLLSRGDDSARLCRGFSSHGAISKIPKRCIIQFRAPSLNGSCILHRTPSEVAVPQGLGPRAWESSRSALICPHGQGSRRVDGSIHGSAQPGRTEPLPQTLQLGDAPGAEALSEVCRLSEMPGFWASAWPALVRLHPLFPRRGGSVRLAACSINQRGPSTKAESPRKHSPREPTLCPSLQLHPLRI